MTPEEAQEFIFNTITWTINIFSNKGLFGPILNQIFFNSLVQHDVPTTTIFRLFNYAPEARIAELRGFIDNLQGQQFTIQDVSWDGNCAFAAIAAGFKSERPYTHETLRTMVANYIPTSDLAESMTLQDKIDINTPNAAVGQQAIVAAANVLNVNIYIHLIDGGVIPIQPFYESVENIHLGYTGNHYFLLLPYHQDINNLANPMAGLHINPHASSFL